MTTIENQQQSISIPTSRAIATVQAYPEEVIVNVTADDGALTVEQALELARQLTVAAELAERLEFTGDDYRVSDLILKGDPDSDGSGTEGER